MRNSYKCVCVRHVYSFAARICTLQIDFDRLLSALSTILEQNCFSNDSVTTCANASVRKHRVEMHLCDCCSWRSAFAHKLCMLCESHSFRYAKNVFLFAISFSPVSRHRFCTRRDFSRDENIQRSHFDGTAWSMSTQTYTGNDQFAWLKKKNAEMLQMWRVSNNFMLSLHSTLKEKTHYKTIHLLCRFCNWKNVNG